MKEKQEFLDKYSTSENRNEMEQDLDQVIDFKNKSTPLAQLTSFGPRVLNNLSKIGVHTIGDMEKIPKEKFLILGYTGRNKLKSVMEVMDKFDVKFKEK